MPQEITGEEEGITLPLHYTPTNNIYQFLRTLDSAESLSQCYQEEFMGGFTREEVRQAIKDFIKDEDIARRSFLDDGESEERLEPLMAKLEFIILRMALSSLRMEDKHGILDSSTLHEIVRYSGIEHNDFGRLTPSFGSIHHLTKEEYNRIAACQMDEKADEIYNNNEAFQYWDQCKEQPEGYTLPMVYSKRDKRPMFDKVREQVPVWSFDRWTGIRHDSLVFSVDGEVKYPRKPYLFDPSHGVDQKLARTPKSLSEEIASGAYRSPLAVSTSGGGQSQQMPVSTQSVSPQQSPSRSRSNSFG